MGQTKDNYIYVYLDPSKIGKYNYGEIEYGYQPFYVGMGKKYRYLEHINEVKRNSEKEFKKNPHKYNTIKVILDLGLEPIIIKQWQNLSREEAIEKEIYLINLIGRHNSGGYLTNIEEGGLGGSPSKETRKKISESVKKRWKEGVYDNKVATPLTEDHKRKIAEAHLGTKRSQESINKQFSTRKGYQHSEETKQKLHETHSKLSVLHSEQTSNSWNDPIIRKKRILGIKEAHRKKRELKQLNESNSTN
jgi:hypothetical protein